VGAAVVLVEPGSCAEYLSYADILTF